MVGALEGRFVHLTDTHLLRAYGAGTDPAKNCIAGRSRGRAGMFGDYKCDNTALVQNLTAEALKHRARPDFVLYGGDHVALKDPNASIADTVWFVRDIARVLRDVQTALGGGVRVFPMLGNHDTFPFYQFPEKGPFYIYEAAADAWKDFLQPASLATVRAGGYYTELVEPGLRIVVVNTAMYFCGNWMFPQRRVDPGQQLAWLRGVLESARASHERVFLAAHVPPGASEKTGSFEMWSSFNDQFVRALAGFHGDPIVASFYGHQHFATYRVIADPNTTAPTAANAHVGFVASSLTPRPNANPSVTEYTFLPRAPYTVLDRAADYIDLRASNEQGRAVWKAAQSYRALFGAAQLDVPTMAAAAAAMHTDRALFAAFYEDLVTHGPLSGNCTSSACHGRVLCSLTNTMFSDFQDCIKRH